MLSNVFRMNGAPRLTVVAAAVIACSVLAGCAGPGVTVNYSPSSVLSAEGRVEVGPFAFDPTPPAVRAKAESRYNRKLTNSQLAAATQVGSYPGSGKYYDVKPNQIRNTAVGSILLDRDIKDIVRDATFAELRFVGISVNGRAQPTLLQGTVEEFLADDLGYSVDWVLRVAYTVTRKADQQPVYKSTKEIKRKTEKFANPFGSINETIRLNIEELIKDEAFIKAIQ